MYVITLGAADGKSNTEKQTANVRKAHGPVGYCRKAAMAVTEGSGGAVGLGAAALLLHASGLHFHHRPAPTAARCMETLVQYGGEVVLK